MSESVGATRALVRSVRELRFEDLSEEARESGRHCLLDSIGCALAGASEALVDILVANVVHPEGASSCRLLGRVEHASPLTAALVNGAMAHALDYDDTHMRMFGHPSVPVMPALLALSESEELSGRELLTSFVVGVETQARLGALMNPEHYASGFHATGTLGSIGAAAAAAHALRLDEDRFCHAVALAATQAAGVKASFGSMAKPLHAGCAAQSGLMAALIARGGFTGNPEILEANQGFAAAYHGESSDASILDRFKDRFLVRDTLFKYHAACYLTHASIEATLSLIREGLSRDDVDAVEVKISPELFKVCTIPEPATGLEGKFSVRGTVAMALLGVDTSDLHAYTAEQMKSPEFVTMRDKVSLTPVESMTTTQATVTVDAGGRRLEASHDAGVPAKHLSEQWDKLTQKFRALTRPVVGSRSDTLYELIADVENLPAARDLLDSARPRLA